MKKQKIRKKMNHIPFRREWPLNVILQKVRLYQDKRAHLVRDKKTGNFELRYSIYSLWVRGWVRKVMKEEEIHSLFNDLYRS